jgi:hypothetical protein
MQELEGEPLYFLQFIHLFLSFVSSCHPTLTKEQGGIPFSRSAAPPNSHIGAGRRRFLMSFY